MSKGAGKPASQRQRRVGGNIRQALTEVLRREAFHGTLLADVSVTVTDVQCSPDLRHATVYILPLGVEVDESGPVVEALNQAAPQLSRHVNSNLHMKYSPRLTFKADRAFAHASNIDAILNSDRVKKDVEHQPE